MDEDHPKEPDDVFREKETVSMWGIEGNCEKEAFAAGTKTFFSLSFYPYNGMELSYLGVKVIFD